jgi:hypothetical protein
MIQNQHLTDLEHALGQLREQRRNWVRTLAAGAGHERGKTESAIESFLKCQTAIDAVGRAQGAIDRLHKSSSCFTAGSGNIDLK